jgi:hypothetical protein
MEISNLFPWDDVKTLKEEDIEIEYNYTDALDNFIFIMKREWVFVKPTDDLCELWYANCLIKKNETPIQEPIFNGLFNDISIKSNSKKINIKIWTHGCELLDPRSRKAVRELFHSLVGIRYINGRTNMFRYYDGQIIKLHYFTCDNCLMRFLNKRKDLDRMGVNREEPLWEYPIKCKTNPRKHWKYCSLKCCFDSIQYEQHKQMFNEEHAMCEEKCTACYMCKHWYSYQTNCERCKNMFCYGCLEERWNAGGKLVGYCKHCLILI